MAFEVLCVCRGFWTGALPAAIPTAASANLGTMTPPEALLAKRSDLYLSVSVISQPTGSLKAPQLGL